ncbi:MAG: RpiB/LacA/LacB family sugar-phosphate isomerase [Candidatus Pacebacteria bacterium]|nr:RpiB/LacA/LacB family sugar-phosphate isomerase [Candidatus Paceibacterota bacterium]PIR59878.1 MAG: ribose-5-phosphate isomerase [Candidatus Pacebacteria bacterium CG10_big_fil_rev_8_21_14_0_10_44_54]
MLPHIYIAADHGGFDQKRILIQFLTSKGYTVTDCGADTLDPEDDYPHIVAKLAAKMKKQVVDQPAFAILLCRSGAGMSMAANRFSHLRAVTAASEEQVRHAREHNNANVLALSADWLSVEEQKGMLLKFLTTPFSDKPRHIRRVQQLTTLG